MSALLLVDAGEDELIDETRYHTVGFQPTVTHAANPGDALMTVGEQRPAELPDPSVGGQNASGRVYGYSTGFQGYRATHQPFMGAVLQVPTEPMVVQGQVGASHRADRLHAGVMDQLTQYTPARAEYVSAYVGPVFSSTMITPGV